MNVRELGVVGDGVVDDTVAIQRAIDYASGPLEFPFGTYKFSTLTLRPTIQNLGDGRGGTVFKGTSVSNAASAGYVNTRIQGVTFDGTTLLLGDPSDVLNVKAAAGFLVEACEFKNVTTQIACVSLYSNTFQLTFSRTFFHTSQRGLYLDYNLAVNAIGPIISDCFIFGMTQHGIEIYNTAPDGTTLSVSQTLFDHNTGSHLFLHDGTTECHVICSGCRFENPVYDTYAVRNDMPGGNVHLDDCWMFGSPTQINPLILNSGTGRIFADGGRLTANGLLANNAGAGQIILDAVCTGTIQGNVERRRRELPRSGASAARPSAVVVGVGSSFFDTTLRRPIWSDGSAWRDSGGNLV